MEVIHFVEEPDGLKIGRKKRRQMKAEAKLKATVDGDRKTTEISKRGELKSTAHFVSDETDLSELVDSHFPDACSHSQPRDLLLTGLHTCGDLAGQVLRMFLVNSNVQAVCQVGCCYHLMEERFQSDPHQRKLESRIDC